MGRALLLIQAGDGLTVTVFGFTGFRINPATLIQWKVKIETDDVIFNVRSTKTPA